MCVCLACVCMCLLGGRSSSTPLLVYMLHTTGLQGFINIDRYKGWIDA